MNRAASSWACAAAALGLTSQLANAQTAGEPALPGLEEVIITSEYRDVSLQKTAISVAVKEGEDLRREGKTRIDEILQGTPGLNLQSGAGAGEVGITIRGITSAGGDPPSAGIPAVSVPVLVDGQAQDRKELVRGGTLDVKRVEVMRGPQSTNVGASALAGAISIVTNDPSLNGYEGSARLEVGNFHLFSSEGVLNVPISETTAIRFAMSTDKRRAYQVDGAGDSDLTNARVKLRWKKSDNLDIVFTVSHNLVGGNGASGTLLTYGRWVPFSQNPVPMNGCVPVNGAVNVTSGGCNPTYTRLLDGSDFRSRKDAWDDGISYNEWPRTPYYDTNVDQFSADVNWMTSIGSLSIQPSYQLTHFNAMTSPRGAANNTQAIKENFRQKTPQLDMRLASLPTSRIEWLAGLYYKSSNRISEFENLFWPGAASCPVSVGSECFTWSKSKYNIQDTYSAYGNFKYPLLERLRLLGGLRYSRDQKRAVSDASGLLGVPGTPFGPGTPYVWLPEYSADWSATNYRAGLEYDVTPKAMAYAVAATGYRPGNVSYSNFTRQVSVTPAYHLTQYTLGFKSRFLDNRLQVNLEAFHALLQNQAVAGSLSTQLATSTVQGSTNCGIAPPPPGLGPTFTVSPNGDCVSVASGAATADQKTRGVDIDINFAPNAVDRLDFAAEYLQSTYDSRPLVNGADFTATQAGILASIAAPTPQAAANAAQLAPLLNNVFTIVDGATLGNAPQWSINASYQHSFLFKNGSRLTPKLTATYKSQYYSGGGGLQQVLSSGPGGALALAYQNAFTTYDVFTTWDTADGRFSFTGYVKNAGNEVVLSNFGTTFVTIEAPRTFGFTMQGHF